MLENKREAETAIIVTGIEMEEVSGGDVVDNAVLQDAVVDNAVVDNAILQDVAVAVAVAVSVAVDDRDSNSNSNSNGRCNKKRPPPKRQKKMADNANKICTGSCPVVSPPVLSQSKTCSCVDCYLTERVAPNHPRCRTCIAAKCTDDNLCRKEQKTETEAATQASKAARAATETATATEVATQTTEVATQEETVLLWKM